MKYIWLLSIVAQIIRILQSDAAKRKRWTEQATTDDHAPLVDRLAALIALAIGSWQSVVLWWSR